MSSRLQPINVTDFTGGINLRSNQFNLADNESPDMLNMSIDPRGGFFTRTGWSRWFDGPQIDAADVADTWDPRSAEALVHLDDTTSVYVTNEGVVWHSHDTDNGAFDDLFIAAPGDLTCEADPHLVDFASWGDVTYMACGRGQPTVKHVNYTLSTVTALLGPSGTDPGEGVNGPGGWNNDYTNPTGGYAPQAEHVEPHAGYLFYANLNEDMGGGDSDYKTRIRWSHPGGQQEDFAYGDYIDIDAGGGRITALLSFQDHLLIFKRDSLWALYGYGNDSWQLIKVSRSIGAPSPTAITRSETAAFFFSSSGRNAIYGYTDGSPVEISDKLRSVMEGIVHDNNVWMSWSNNDLWVNLPWLSETSRIIDPTGSGGSSGIGAPSATDTTTFVFETDIGNGVWTQHRMRDASLGPIVEGADVLNHSPLAVTYRTPTGERCMMELDHHQQAYDVIEPLGVQQVFIAVYATGWFNGDWPELRKSWRRPRFIVRDVADDILVRVDSFKDYDENIDRSHILNIYAPGTAIWRDGGYDDASPGGFDWADETWVDAPQVDGDPPRGARWGAERTGSLIVRTVADEPAGGGFGKARALKLRFVSASGQRWGIDAMVLKMLSRRFTT